MEPIDELKRKVAALEAELEAQKAENLALRMSERQLRVYFDNGPIGIATTGADKRWLNDLFGFAVAPDQVFYLQVGVNDLVPRVLESGKMNYWEAGMDMNYGDDLYDSFIAYQGELIEQFNVMAEEHNFTTLDARQDPKEIQRQLRRAVGEYLESSGYRAHAHLSSAK